MFRKTFRAFALLLALFLSLGSGSARAEVSLLNTYNTLFHTTYDSLDAIAFDGYRVAPGDSWTLSTMNSLQIMAMDTSSSADISLKTADTTTLLYDPAPWPGVTRGYELTGLLDLTDAKYGISEGEAFSLYVGGIKISDINARMFLAPDPALGFLIGYNDNGAWYLGDKDMNEPLIYGNVSATPIPGAVWLLGTGLLGLIGLRRKNS